MIKTVYIEPRFSINKKVYKELGVRDLYSLYDRAKRYISVVAMCWIGWDYKNIKSLSEGLFYFHYLLDFAS